MATTQSASGLALDTTSAVETQNPAVGVQRKIGDPEGDERSGQELATITEEVSTKLRCPVCQGMSVADSPSASARAMKGEIEDLLASGYSEAQVKTYFENTYGEFVLLDPKREGLNWLVLLAPAAGFFGGLAWLLSWNRRAHQTAESEEDLDEYLDQVRSNLESRA